MYQMFRCNQCGDDHPTELTAAACCPPRKVYYCDYCHKPSLSEELAEYCEQRHQSETSIGAEIVNPQSASST